MTQDTEPAGLETELESALANGYATVHELETRSMQLQRHCEALMAGAADAEQIRAVMRARKALGEELERLRARLEQMRTAGG